MGWSTRCRPRLCPLCSSSSGNWPRSRPARRSSQTPGLAVTWAGPYIKVSYFVFYLCLFVLTTVLFWSPTQSNTMSIAGVRTWVRRQTQGLVRASCFTITCFMYLFTEISTLKPDPRHVLGDLKSWEFHQAMPANSNRSVRTEKCSIG